MLAIGAEPRRSLIRDPGPWLEPPRATEVRARARAFAEREVAPRARHIDRANQEPHGVGSVDWSFLRTAVAEGWLTCMAPRALGGEGARSTEVAVAMEEICAACGGLGLLIGANSLGLSALLFSMDLGLWARVVRAAARERASPPTRPTLFAWAITEPSSGSDVEHPLGLAKVSSPCWAERVANGYRLHGRKAFTSNGSIARYIVVHAALDRSRPRASWTAFLVDTTREGFVAARDEQKLGQRASPATETVFDGVFVPELDRVGPEGAGFELTELILAGSRGPVGAIATGIARGALEATLRAVSRLPREHPNSSAEPWVKDSVAEMTLRLHAARLAYLDATLAFDTDVAPAGYLQAAVARGATPAVALLPAASLKRGCETGFTRFLAGLAQAGALEAQLARASSAKAFCADTAVWVCDRACDLVPPSDPDRATVDKALRDAKLAQIYEGTNQINRLTVGEHLLGSDRG